MYALIYKTGSFLGVFSSKAHMQVVIEQLIKDHYETDGCHGNYNFRWVKFTLNEPWFTKNNGAAPEESKAILSLFTMHEEKFIHKVKTDWSTGKIISMDSDSTTNI